MAEKSINERLAVLETQRLSDMAAWEIERLKLEEELKDIRIILRYYNKIALKWGGFAIAIMSLGAGLSLSADKIKEILVKVLSIWTAP